MKYFENVQTLDDLKRAYRLLAMKHHPDVGGDLATMTAINNEHDELFELLKKQQNAKAQDGKTYATTETPEEFREIIETLLRMDGLEVELCGSWLWIGGETKKHKEALKAAGCRWSRKKGLWYWHHAEDGSRRHRGSKSMEEIRETYGSQTFRGKAAENRLKEALA